MKAVKQFGVHRPLLLAGLVMASASTQASVTISTGNGIADRIVDAGSISIRANIEVDGRNSGLILAANPGPLIPNIQPPAIFLNTPSALSSVSGSMNYSVGMSYGNFSENDANPDGSIVALDLNRKGYGYHAEALAQTGQAHARVETQWVPSSANIYGYHSNGSSSANATSTWSDWFVISGGTGLGTASFASGLNGMMASGKNGSAGYNLNIGYSTGAFCDYWYNTCDETDQAQTLFSQSSNLVGKGKSTLSQDVEGEFSFEYGKAFQLTSTLNVNATNGGMANFNLASLGNSLELPVGSQLLSSSGLYIQAVPEAETYAMMLAGLGLVGFAVARRRALERAT